MHSAMKLITISQMTMLSQFLCIENFLIIFSHVHYLSALSFSESFLWCCPETTGIIEFEGRDSM